METPWVPRDNPWKLLCSGESSPVSIMLENLGYTGESEFAGLQTFRHDPLGRVSIVRHPLWTDDHPVYLEARAEARRTFRNCVVDAVNPFEIIRHPASVLAAM